MNTPFSKAFSAHDDETVILTNEASSVLPEDANDSREQIAVMEAFRNRVSEDNDDAESKPSVSSLVEEAASVLSENAIFSDANSAKDSRDSQLQVEREGIELLKELRDKESL